MTTSVSETDWAGRRDNDRSPGRRYIIRKQQSNIYATYTSHLHQVREHLGRNFFGGAAPKRAGGPCPIVLVFFHQVTVPYILTSSDIVCYHNHSHHCCNHRCLVYVKLSFYPMPEI